MRIRQSLPCLPPRPTSSPRSAPPRTSKSSPPKPSAPSLRTPFGSSSSCSPCMSPASAGRPCMSPPLPLPMSPPLPLPMSPPLPLQMPSALPKITGVPLSAAAPLQPTLRTNASQPHWGPRCSMPSWTPTRYHTTVSSRATPTVKTILKNWVASPKALLP